MQLEGSRRHVGRLEAGAQWLHARREGAQDPSLNGLEPTNVPARTLKLHAAYAVPQVQGLALLGAAVYESARKILPDNSAEIPGWTRFDLGARYELKQGQRRWTLRAGIDNVSDRR